MTREARITIILSPDEKSALIAFAEHEHRDPRRFAGLLLRRELESAGFLQPAKSPTPQPTKENGNGK